jgi:hypothetical protein
VADEQYKTIVSENAENSNRATQFLCPHPLSWNGDRIVQFGIISCLYFTGRRGKETISRRNERERRRVRQISEGFCELRKRLMIQPRNRKLPKLQILRKAILYIKNLQDMIRESDLQNASDRNRLAACPTTPSEMPVTLRKYYSRISLYGRFSNTDTSLIWTLSNTDTSLIQKSL